MPTIPLTRGQRAKVDWRDYRALSSYKWHAIWSPGTRSFYAQRSTDRPNRTTIRMHRQILGVSDRLQVDHKNHDTLDNRRANLRIVSSHGNHENRRDQSRWGPGVSRLPSGRFKARVRWNGGPKQSGLIQRGECSRCHRTRPHSYGADVCQDCETSDWRRQES